MFNASINDQVSVTDGVLSICGERLNRFEIQDEIGRGANGIVYRAMRKALAKPCAIKVWLTLRSNDTRDKVIQGIAEARKIADAHPEWVPHIYDAETIGTVFYSSMEYVPGPSLKSHLQTSLSLEQRWWLARLYLNGIRATTSQTSAHGDAHVGNVVVYERDVDRGIKAQSLKLIDFGTSMFTHPEQSRKRHWQVVDETLQRILNPFKGVGDECDRLANDFREIVNDYDVIKLAMYDDLLDDLKVKAGIKIP